MAKSRELRAFDYVNRPYEEVRDRLTRDALVVFQSATRSASDRAEAVAAALKVTIGGIEVAADIAVGLTDVRQHPAGPDSPPMTVMQVEWEAARSPRLFPLMKAELSIYPLTATETQLDFSGRYEPPLGLVGSAADAILGHRIAEASVHRFVTDVASYLRREMAGGAES